MINLYTVIVFITVIVLCITVADIMTNCLISKVLKQRSVIVCILIGCAISCEWIGVVTNGAPLPLIGLHKYAKLTEFCLSPAIGAAAAMAYGKIKHPKIVIGGVIVHAVIECLAMPHGAVFRIDEANFYIRGGMYWIYVAFFSVYVIYCFVCIVREGKRYQSEMNSVLWLTLFLLAAGIGIQMKNSEIRVVFMCVVISNLLLYNHHCKMILQVDPVTHLLNRICYENHMENLASSVLILLFDVNKFKRVNDTYGHAVGDICLERVAALLRSVYGKYGSCYRIGGDEFCVIMNKSMEKAENLNRQFKDDVNMMIEKDGRMTSVAVGYAYYDADRANMEKAVEEADSMMYKDKG